MSRVAQPADRQLPFGISMYGFGVAGGAWGGAFSEQVAVPYADAMLVPLPAGVDPVAVASVADTLSDAYRHIGPYVERVRRHPEGPSIILFGAMRRGSIFGASVPLMPRRSPAHWSRRRMCSSLRLGLGYVGTRPGWVSRPASREPSDGVRRSWSSTPAQIRAVWWRPFRLPRSTGSAAAPSPCTLLVKIPAARMFGRNSTLTVARSHIRTVIPEVLDLVAAERIRPESVTMTIASFEDAPKVLSDHLRGGAAKTILVPTR
jgi:alcohol dehydrogenase